MKRLSFRQKLLVTYAACALTLIFVTFASVSVYINGLQKKNVENAVRLAEEQAQHMAVAVSEILKANEGADFRDPSVQAGLRAVTQVNLSINKSLLYAAVISPDGDRFVEEVGEKGRETRWERDGEQVTQSDLPLPGGNTLTVTVQAKPAGVTDITMPIEMGGSKPGKVELRLAESDTFHRIEESSQQITRILLWGSLLMLLFLLGIFLLLWRMFFRQLELQEKNAKLDQMAYVGTLASGLAHEIRNPLSAMSINLEVIREELAEMPASVADHTSQLSRRVQDEVGRLNSTLTNFLDFALPRKEGYSQFPLRGLIEELLEVCAEELKAHDITVDLDAPAIGATTIEADRHLLHRALRNILVNAIQILAGSVKKQLRIQIVERPRDYILLSITDSGPGIPEQELSKIFDVFYTTRKGGSGFGLAIARKIVQEHNGRMWAENNQDALGATFFIELPRFAPLDEHQDSPAKKRHRLIRDRKTSHA